MTYFEVPDREKTRISQTGDDQLKVRSINKHKNQLQRVALALALLTILIILLGAYVRLTGAGLSCPDWPLCFGKAVPPQFDHGILQEVSHRYLASLLGLGILYFLVLSFQIRHRWSRLWRAALFLFLLLIVQALFGGATVIFKLNPLVVTTHLILGTILFQLLALIAVDLSSSAYDTTAKSKTEKRDSNAETTKSSQLVLGTAVILVVAQIALGGLVASTGSARVCPEFPGCSTETFFPLTPPGQLVHMLHRTLGISITILLILFHWQDSNVRTRRRRKYLSISDISSSAFIVSIALIQVGIGIIAALLLWYTVSLLPTSLALVFSVGALGYLSALSFLVLGLVFSLKVFRLSQISNTRSPRFLKMSRETFNFSLVYLSLFFVILVVDSTIL